MTYDTDVARGGATMPDGICRRDPRRGKLDRKVMRVIARAHRLLAWRLVQRMLPHGVVAVALCGCVVTTSPPIGNADECPPSFLGNEADPPVSAFVRVDRALPEFKASVPLRSCATSKPFVARYFLDGKMEFVRGGVPPSGDVRRTAAITVPLKGKATGCLHKLELLATSAFVSDDARTPQKQDDLAYIVWWIYLDDAVTPGRTLEECP